MDSFELTRRFKVLQRRLEEGSLKIAHHLKEGFESSYKNVIFDGQGNVIPDSVDGRIRSLLTTIAYFADRQEWKEAASLKEIQEAYFTRLSHAFGEPFHAMNKAGVSPYDFADWYGSDPERVRESVGFIDEFVAEILEFWKKISEPTWIHLEDSQDSKAIFSGEIFPDGSKNIASGTGIYFDTTILPDPFVKISNLLQFMSDAERCSEVLRLALQVLQYRDLALADVSIPIIAILPDKHNSQQSYREFIQFQAREDAVRHAKRLFGQEFSDFDDLSQFLASFESSNLLVSALKQPQELVFATEWEGTLADQLERYKIEQAGKIGVTSSGAALLLQLVSRFAQAQDALQRSKDLRGIPVIRAETSWLWFNWMLRDNTTQLAPEAQHDLHIQRALQSVGSRQLSWLDDIPSDALIEIRKVGALEEIRLLLGKGIRDIVEARPHDFTTTGSRVFDNLDSAFRDHQRHLQALRSKKWKFAGRDVGSFVVVGGIELTAAITGVPLFGALAATAGMSGVVPTAKDIRDRLKRLREEQTSIDTTGVGILFKHAERARDK